MRIKQLSKEINSQQPEELTCQGGRESADRNNISSGYLGIGKPKEYLPADNTQICKLCEKTKDRHYRKKWCKSDTDYALGTKFTPKEIGGIEE